MRASRAQNQGVMRALDGSTLTITDTDLDNSGGTIEAQTGGTVSFTGANTRITGGVLTGDGDFDLRGSATLVDLRNEARTAVANAQTGRIEGSIDNAGVIALESIGSQTTLTILGDTTLSGGGTVEMSNNSTTGSPDRPRPRC
jgi:adhesin HecA-like repeat protein